MRTHERNRVSLSHYLCHLGGHVEKVLIVRRGGAIATRLADHEGGKAVA